MASVKIYNEKDGKTHVYINGHELPRVKSIDFEQSVDTVPTFSFETYSKPDIFMDDAYVELRVLPSDLQGACSMIRDAYLYDISFRQAFIAGIQDVLVHGDADATPAELAEMIAERVIG